MSEWAIVADLTRAKTLKGGLVARAAAGLPFLLTPGMEVAFVPPQLDAPRRGVVESITQEGPGSGLVRFSTVDSIDAAERLAGCKCLARRSCLPEHAFVQREDGIEGFRVQDVRRGDVGKAVGIVENPAQPLLEVLAPDADKTVLIPLVEEFVVDVDEDARVITVDLPEGLLDL